LLCVVQRELLVQVLVCDGGAAGEGHTGVDLLAALRLGCEAVGLAVLARPAICGGVRLREPWLARGQFLLDMKALIRDKGVELLLDEGGVVKVGEALAWKRRRVDCLGLALQAPL